MRWSAGVALRCVLAGVSASFLVFYSDEPGAKASASEYVRTGMQVVAEGGLLDWSADGSSIYYDHLEPDGYYDVWRMDADGTDQVYMTCDHPQLPNRNQGNPVLHPEGRYLVFQAEKASHDPVGTGFTEPGFGRFNDLWALDLDTSDAFQLTAVASSGFAGTLQPQFSNDGSKLLWGQLEGGTGGLNDWALMVAGWTTSPLPLLANAVAYNPGPAPLWLEVHGWGADDIYNDAPGTVRDQDPCGSNGWPSELAGNNNILNIADINSFLSPARGSRLTSAAAAPSTTSTTHWTTTATVSSRSPRTRARLEGPPSTSAAGTSRRRRTRRRRRSTSAT